MKLLVADDQHSLHLYLDTMMNWGELDVKEVKHTYDGKETLVSVREFKPHLLILDIRMPFMSGLDMLKELQDLPTKPKTVILSAHDEFEYAREALRLHVEQYLLKPVDITLLQSAIRGLVAQIREEYQKTLAQEFGKWVHAQSLHSDALEKIHEAFHVLNIDHYLLLEVRGELPAEKLPTDWMADQDAVAYFDIYRKSPDSYACLLGLDKDISAGVLLELIKRLWEHWQAINPNIQLSIGLSQKAKDSAVLSDLLKQSEEANLMYFYSPHSVNMFEAGWFDEEWTLNEHQHYEKGFEEKISYAFHMENILQLSGELFQEFRRKRLHPEKVYAFILQHLYTIGQSNNCSDLKWSDSEELSIDFLRKFRKLNDLEVMFNGWIRHLGDRPADAHGWHETIKQVKQYVELNYGEDVSLQTVSQLFSIDRYQLSRLFKQECQMNYWSFVMNVRMKKAAEMLAGTQLKNSVIAEATGFVDESHFSRVFKKHYKVTPKQYRQSGEKTF